MNIRKIFSINAYIKRIKWLLMFADDAIAGIRDAAHLKKQFPELQNFNTLLDEKRQELLPYYEKYVTEVSNDGMAVSLELAVFLIVICEIIKPKSILDLGTGFSSFVFRTYARNATPKPVICSVDDSAAWLQKTKEFLNDKGLDSEKLVTWESFQKENNAQFDLISHDLGSMELRAETLKDILKLMNPGGVIILDDMHKLNYNIYAKRILKESNSCYYNLKGLVKDKFKRYSFLIVS